MAKSLFDLSARSNQPQIIKSTSFEVFDESGVVSREISKTRVTEKFFRASYFLLLANRESHCFSVKDGPDFSVE